MLLFVDVRRTILFKSILLSILLGAIALTSYCKDSSDQKIQQLQEAWLQKAQELSDLGEKIAQKHRLLKNISLDIGEYWNELSSHLEGQAKEDYMQALCTSTVKNFCPKLTQLFCERVDIKGFVKKEVLTTENPAGFNMAHFGIVRAVLEKELLSKLVEHYDNCLQELAEIDHELVALLGRPSAFA